MLRLVLHSCPTLCDPVDCSPPGSSVHGILQARRLEWVATASSRGSSPPGGLLHCRLIPQHLSHQEKPQNRPLNESKGMIPTSIVCILEL